MRIEDSEHREVETLSPEDAAAVDAILDRAAAGENPPEKARVERAQAWLAVLGAAAAPEAPSDLADRALAAIERDRMKLVPSDESLEKSAAASFWQRWSQRIAVSGAGAVAAALLLTVTIMGVGQARQSKARVACSENIQKFGSGIGTFAAEHASQLPLLAIPSDHDWLHSKDADGPRSNSANLLPLVTGGYVGVASLYCPGGGIPATLPTLTSDTRDIPNIGYSYVMMYSAVRPNWNGDKAAIILADRSPMFLADSVTTAADENSANHGGHGTYVLHADGSGTWATSPNVGPAGDNIWTVMKGKERVTVYQGTEAPVSLADAFLCP